MTRREFDTYAECACPCGTGQVLRHVASTDYRHDKPKITYSLDCVACSVRWRVDHGTLVDKASELSYLATKAHDDEARKKLTALAQEVTRMYLSTMVFKSRKAELDYLIANNLSGTRYTSYLKDCASGRPMHELAYGQRSPSWLLAAAKDDAVRTQLAALLEQARQAASTTEVAAKQIIRRGLR